MLVKIDCTSIADRTALHEALTQALSLPGYYGKNLDALFDCLTDIEEPTEICLVGYDTLCEKLGRYGSLVKRVICDASRENNKISLIIE